MAHKRWTSLAGCLLATAVVRWPARAAVVTVPLLPATAQIGLTVFELGLWPLPGHFDQFAGRLMVNTGNAGDCHVTLRIEVASFRMDDPGRTRTALGPLLLDAAHYPGLVYDGTCMAGTATGMLTLHGVTRPLILTTTRDGNTVNARGSLRRADFGVSGLPGLIGRRVDMRLSVTLPPELAKAGPSD